MLPSFHNLRSILFLPLLLVLMSSCAFVSEDNKSGKFDSDKIQSYIDTYPQSQLRDFYKFCFQDYFGLEHLIGDSSSVANYINFEIARTPDSDWNTLHFCYPLLDSNYYRIDLGFVRDSVISLATMVHAMLESSRLTAPVDSLKLDMWKQQWQAIIDTIIQGDFQLLNLERDKAYIDSLLSIGVYAVHHSDIFNQTYRQHYRIVRRDIYEKTIKPLINETETIK